MDEGGGFYDSGYIQPLDFFGDGPRIPMIVVSPFTQRRPHQSRLLGSRLDFEVHRAQLAFAAPHARSRDNFPNPISLPFNPYVPLNSPALGDLFDLFDFDHDHGNH